MREIKFRVWDKRAKQFWYFDLNNSCNFDPDNLKEALQYIELKDKNGKEIYEGDIVRYKCGDFGKKITFPICEVKYTTEHFTDGEYGYSMGVGFKIDWNEEDEPEVIGNIYENPELLKEKEMKL